MPKKESKTGKKTKLDEAHKSTNRHFNSADHQLGEERALVWEREPLILLRVRELMGDEDGDRWDAREMREETFYFYLGKLRIKYIKNFTSRAIKGPKVYKNINIF